MRLERLRAGLALADAAAAMEVPPERLASWESGEGEPYAEHVVLMSRLYDCSPDYLLCLADDRRFGLVGR